MTYIYTMLYTFIKKILIYVNCKINPERAFQSKHYFINRERERERERERQRERERERERERMKE